MGIVANRYDFMYLLACENGNPNGDPDGENMPRMDNDTGLGYITDCATKRRVRDYVSFAHGGEPGMNLLVESNVNLCRKVAEAKEAAGVACKDETVPAIEAGRKSACELYYDVRTFGAVMSIKPNAGQVRGPVQIGFGQSVDPIRPQNIGITCVARADSEAGADAKRYRELEAKSGELRNMGRKTFIPFGLYVIKGTVSANLAAQTGFDEQDLSYLFEALANMYDMTRSSSKGLMSVVSPVIIFKHVGDPSVSVEEQAHQALLGRAPSYKLFELVDVHKKDGVADAAGYRDYDCSIALSKLPSGVEVGFLPSYGTGITWGKLPDGENWMKSV